MWRGLSDRLRTAIPEGHWLSDYGRAELRGDLKAGLTVGVMVIPQGMAYAVIAGLPPIYGLYAVLVPPVVYAALGSSRQLSIGPIALIMVIVAAGVSGRAAAGSARYVELAILLAAMAGLVQIGLGLVRFGFMADLLSRPVITGFTAAAALIIGFSQLGNLLGVELGGSQYVYVLAREAVQHVGRVHPLSLALGLGTIVLLLGMKRWEAFPGELLVVGVGTLLAWSLGLAAEGVEVVGSVPGGLPMLQVPAIPDAETLRALLPAALTLALVQFMSTVSLGRVFAKRHDYSLDANREVTALGAANFAGSFFQALPVAGSFSRSAVSGQAGARTPLANVVVALLVALTLLFLTALLYYLPLPVLAGLIIAAAAGLIDLGEVRTLFQIQRREGAVALFTFATTLVIGIQEGLLLGMAASLVVVLYRLSRPNVAELDQLPGTRSFRDRSRFEEACPVEDVLLLRVDAAFSFPNAEFLKDYILEKSRGERSFHAVVIDGTSINDLDTTAVETLFEVIDALEAQDIELHVTGLIGPVRELMRRSGLRERLGEDRFHLSPHQAVLHLLRQWDAEDDGDRLARYRAAVEAGDEAPDRASS